jgi:tRNA pseudouridine55 synthase
VREYTAEEVKEGQILLFDKPYKWTSFQLVNKVRWLLCRKHGWKKLKVGHAGTLDPLATGLMILCTGKATKQIMQLTGKDKEYIADIKFGETTPSFDLETEVDKRFPTEQINKERIQAALEHFMGEQDQIPPMFSAKYVNGVRAYELARQGVTEGLKASSIYIHHFELLNYENAVGRFRINCSKGTYIRSLARDLGEKLDSGAHLTGLTRTKIGEFKLSDAINVEEFEKKLNINVTNR